MSIVRIKSDNPNLSYLLGKNPSSGVLIKSIKQGYGYGYFNVNDQSEYILYFKDSPDEISFKKYKDQEYEYLDNNQYNSPLSYFSLLNDFIGDTVNKYSEQYQGNDSNNAIVFSGIHVQRPIYLERLLKEFDISYVLTKMSENMDKNYILSMSNNGSVSYLYDVSRIVSLILTIDNPNDYIFIEDKFIEKYVKVLNNIDATYHMRYMFKTKIIADKSRIFKTLKSELEKSSRYSINFSLGDNFYSRYVSIINNIDKCDDIIDLGCGEGRYTLSFAKSHPDTNIHAIDINEELLEVIDLKAEKRKFDNIQTYNSIETFKDINEDSTDTTIVCSEVIEHIELSDLPEFFNSVKEISFKKLIITTPNREFNPFYNIEENEFRHDDHKFELTSQEFIDLINGNFSDYNKTFSSVGDTVNGISSTQMVIIGTK